MLAIDCDRATTAALRYGGYMVRTLPGWKRASNRLGREQFGAIVVDLDRAADAEEAVRELRLRTDIPILAVGAHTDETYRIAILDAGADDYLPEPFGVEALLAYLRARLRRTVTTEDDSPVVTSAFTIHLADRRVVLADGEEQPLAPLEWRVAEILLRRAGHLVPQDEVLTALWGSEGLHKGYHLRALMSAIRHKLEPDPGRPRYFVTVAGLGVKFEPDKAR